MSKPIINIEPIDSSPHGCCIYLQPLTKFSILVLERPLPIGCPPIGAITGALRSCCQRLLIHIHCRHEPQCVQVLLMTLVGISIARMIAILSSRYLVKLSQYNEANDVGGEYTRALLNSLFNKQYLRF